MIVSDGVDLAAPNTQSAVAVGVGRNSHDGADEDDADAEELGDSQR